MLLTTKPRHTVHAMMQHRIGAVAIDPLGANEMRIKSLKLMIFMQENFEFLMNLISMLLYVAAILKAYC